MYFGNYYFYKWAKAADKAAEIRKTEKHLNKHRKKFMIQEHGYDYYLRDKLWKRIQKQWKSDDYYSWKRRLASFGFTVNGLDFKRNEQHEAPSQAFIHDFDYNDDPDDIEVYTKFKIKKEKPVMSFDVTSRLKALEGETFYTVNGLPFTYHFVNAHMLKTSRTDYAIHVSNFEKAVEINPVKLDDVRSLRGYSYVFGVVTDSRFKN